jgi:hypothetical protein
MNTIDISINFQYDVNLFDVAGQFPNEKPQTYTYFYVQKVPYDQKNTQPDNMSDIPF